MTSRREGIARPRDPGYPCFPCGVNAWTTCRHREASPEPVRPMWDTDARQRTGPLNGLMGGAQRPGPKPLRPTPSKYA